MIHGSGCGDPGTCKYKPRKYVETGNTMIATKLAEPIEIKGRSIKNRLTALPMEANDAETDGRPSTRTLERYRRLAAGGWGTIYIEAIAPSEQAKSRPRQLLISEANLDSFKSLIDNIRAAAEPAPFVIAQVNHAGRYGLRPLIAYHSELLDTTWNIPPDMPVATTAELETAAAETADAIRLAARAGADAVDAKCCHGYLAAELLRPSNTRMDKYGGCFENRARFLDALLAAGADAERDTGALFGSRVSLHECFEGGIGTCATDPTEIDGDAVKQIIERIDAAGASFICETMGVPYLNPDKVRPFRGCDNIDGTVIDHFVLAGMVKFFAPDMISIGSAYSILGAEFAENAEATISLGMADLVGLGRQSFADPETPKKILAGDPDAVRWCKGCKRNNCSALLRAQKEVGCVIHDDYYKKLLKNI